MSTQIHRMEPRWIGPYLVVESLNKGRVKLKNISTDKILRNTYNISNLKVYSNKQGSSPNQCPDDSVKGTVNRSLQQKEQETTAEETDIIVIQPVLKQMQIRTFNPLTISRRTCLSTTMALLLKRLYIVAALEILNNPGVYIKRIKGGGGSVTSWP